MDTWLKDILPDKDPYHYRERDQIRKKGGSGIRVPGLMGIYCVPIPAEFFLYSDEAVFMQGYPPRKENNVA